MTIFESVPYTHSAFSEKASICIQSQKKKKRFLPRETLRQTNSKDSNSFLHVIAFQTFDKNNSFFSTTMKPVLEIFNNSFKKSTSHTLCE